MKLNLNVTAGPGAGRTIMLNSGQVVSIGRTDDADYSFGENGEMSSIHFLVELTDDMAILRDRNSTNGTFVNGVRTSEERLQTGDQIKAGRSVFQVELIRSEESVPPTSSPDYRSPDHGRGSLGDPTPSSHTIHSIPTATINLPVGIGFAPVLIESTAALAKITEPAKRLLNSQFSPTQYVEKLVAAELFSDAIHFLAQALPKRDAVLWGVRSVRSLASQLDERNRRTLETCEAWGLEPNESIRRKAQVAAQELEFKTAAAWVAMGVFWSTGSMGPPDVAVLPSAPELTGHAIAGAVILAVVSHEPARSSDRYRQAVAWGLDAGRSDDGRSRRSAGSSNS